MNRILAATGVIVAIAATGCSALGVDAKPSGTGAPAAHSSSPGPAAYHQAAQCIRQHGVPNFPDPTQNPQTGRWDLPPGTRKPPPNVMNACKALLDRLPETRGDESAAPLSPAEMAKARQWAQCMRQHGVADWPDPEPDGTFVVPQRLANGNLKRSLRPQLQTCRRYGGGRIRLRAQPHG
ncbi:MAG TPA: hypothetical protein VF069_23010 [Streptosporangiaceae bacterium]